MRTRIERGCKRTSFKVTQSTVEPESYTLPWRQTVAVELNAASEQKVTREGTHGIGRTGNTVHFMVASDYTFYEVALR